MALPLSHSPSPLHSLEHPLLPLGGTVELRGLFSSHLRGIEVGLAVSSAAEGMTGFKEALSWKESISLSSNL